MLQVIDSAIIDCASSRAHKAIVIVNYIFNSSSAAIPGLPDWFYFDRIGELVEQGVLDVVAEGEDCRFHLVKAAAGASGNQ